MVRGFKKCVHLMDGRMRKKLGMLAANMRQKMGIVKTLKLRQDRNGDQRLVKLNKDLQEGN
jgi:hypothetical protein